MEKPREKFLKIGNPKKLETEELLSILLSHGTEKTNVYDLSIKISDFLRLKTDKAVSIEELMQFEGIGEVKAMQILSALELGRRYFNNSENKKLSVDDWDFSNLKQSQRQNGVHFFHHYTAKFIPQIPANIIKRYIGRNRIVVDPFMGSGTTLVEAKLFGCHSYGLDTNPMAIKIANSKTLIINEERISEIRTFLYWLKQEIQKSSNFNIDPEEELLFNNSHLWFRPDVAQKIKIIISRIEFLSPDVKNFIEVGLSTLLKGISNARMDSVTPVLPDGPNYVDRKHYYRNVDNLTRKIPVYERLYSQINRMTSAILEFNKETDSKLICNPILGDARHLDEFVNLCDLVITSPPYWSAQNYERIHMLSMKLFNLDINGGLEIGRNEKAYFDDMKSVFIQIANILHGHFAFVIGHDENNNSHEKLFYLALDIGFNHVDTARRNISNQVSRAKQIKTEYIYIFSI